MVVSVVFFYLLKRRVLAEDASTPGQAARATLHFDNKLIAAPPRIPERYQYPGRRGGNVALANHGCVRRLPRREGFFHFCAQFRVGP
jgi:hypothetical protein